jgi:hypothetical protein
VVADQNKNITIEDNAPSMDVIDKKPKVPD